MASGAIIRVICDDGPYQGMRYMNADTGAILYSTAPETADCVYQLVQQSGWMHSSMPHARLVTPAQAEA